MNSRQQRGFSMIEVLVTLILISVGVLGMVALQGKAIAYTQDSTQRTAAAMLADDLIELIRANPDEILDSDGKMRGTSGYYKLSGADFPTLPSSCTPTPTAASSQIACWAADASNRLPISPDLLNQEFYIARSTTPGASPGSGGAIEIQLAWSVKSGECLEGTSSSTPEVCHYVLRTQL